MIRVVVAEDQALVLGALAALLGLEDDIAIVAQAPDGAAALAAVRAHEPDVLVSDIEMPGLTGLDVAEALAAERSRTRVVIVTTFGRSGYLRRALDAGVRGYLLKDAPPTCSPTRSGGLPRADARSRPNSRKARGVHPPTR